MTTVTQLFEGSLRVKTNEKWTKETFSITNSNLQVKFNKEPFNVSVTPLHTIQAIPSEGYKCSYQLVTPQGKGVLTFASNSDQLALECIEALEKAKFCSIQDQLINKYGTSSKYFSRTNTKKKKIGFLSKFSSKSFSIVNEKEKEQKEENIQIKIETEYTDKEDEEEGEENNNEQFESQQNNQNLSANKNSNFCQSNKTHNKKQNNNNNQKTENLSGSEFLGLVLIKFGSADDLLPRFLFLAGNELQICTDEQRIDNNTENVHILLTHLQIKQYPSFIGAMTIEFLHQVSTLFFSDLKIKEKIESRIRAAIIELEEKNDFLNGLSDLEYTEQSEDEQLYNELSSDEGLLNTLDMFLGGESDSSLNENENGNWNKKKKNNKKGSERKKKKKKKKGKDKKNGKEKEKEKEKGKGKGKGKGKKKNKEKDKSSGDEEVYFSTMITKKSGGVSDSKDKSTSSNSSSENNFVSKINNNEINSTFIQKNSSSENSDSSEITDSSSISNSNSTSITSRSNSNSGSSTESNSNSNTNTFGKPGSSLSRTSSTSVSTSSEEDGNDKFSTLVKSNKKKKNVIVNLKNNGSMVYKGKGSNPLSKIKSSDLMEKIKNSFNIRKRYDDSDNLGVLTETSDSSIESGSDSGTSSSYSSNSSSRSRSGSSTGSGSGSGSASGSDSRLDFSNNENTKSSGNSVDEVSDYNSFLLDSGSGGFVERSDDQNNQIQEQSEQKLLVVFEKSKEVDIFKNFDDNSENENEYKKSKIFPWEKRGKEDRGSFDGNENYDGGDDNDDEDIKNSKKRNQRKVYIPTFADEFGKHILTRENSKLRDNLSKQQTQVDHLTLQMVYSAEHLKMAQTISTKKDKSIKKKLIQKSEKLQKINVQMQKSIQNLESKCQNMEKKWKDLIRAGSKFESQESFRKSFTPYQIPQFSNQKNYLPVLNKIRELQALIGLLCSRTERIEQSSRSEIGHKINQSRLKDVKLMKSKILIGLLQTKLFENRSKELQNSKEN
ncbi:glycine-rich protein [Anaeramoeba flamelloides]|uniref:Glycine-rich protein n=1 Tax=Anaeramoeba flamelloides TaxID=1746091 RepID=A0ABQ8XQX4_9EUKA|nr:glycine-rich protein [Anaeramoeba flamelloides]